jgi:pimeloyl-ACP methyl ester carboxylesterase
MKYKEYGKGNQKTIVLLHGGGLSWWSYREAAQILQDDYHVILPILDGHAGSDRSFTTIEDNAAEIIDFIRSDLGGSVYLLGGLSLGAQVALEMLSQQGDICEYAIIESAAVIPSRVIHALIRPSIACSYGLIKQKWFARLQFRSLKIKNELYDDYYRDTCSITKEDMIAFLRANTSYTLKKSLNNTNADVRIYYGEKEIRGIKQSAQRIKELLPNASVTQLSGMVHGEFSINHAADYVKTIRAV